MIRMALRWASLLLMLNTYCIALQLSASCWQRLWAGLCITKGSEETMLVAFERIAFASLEERTVFGKHLDGIAFLHCKGAGLE